MESGSSEKLAMVYETLNNIETTITRLQERTVQIHTVDYHWYLCHTIADNHIVFSLQSSSFWGYIYKLFVQTGVKSPCFCAKYTRDLR